MSQGLVTYEQVQEARQRALGSKRPLQDELVNMGFVTEDQIVNFFQSADSTIETVDLYSAKIDPNAVNLVPYDLTQKRGLIPIGVKDNTLICAMSNPFDIIAMDEIKQLTGFAVKPMVASRRAIMEAVKRDYNLDESVYDLYKNLPEGEDITIIRDGKDGHESIFELEEDAKMIPIIKLVNMMITDAIKMRSSDIHLEPKTNELELRYRIDGVLRKIMGLPMELLPALISRIKILSELDIAERRKPQDGRARIKFRDKEIDLRISILPTFLGEKAVIRILDTEAAGGELEVVGFSEKELKQYHSFLNRPQGMLLITGPTGSGKTTTLYASLKHLNDGTKNITTVENPVEYQLDGINQIQINEAAGVNFASSLRSILRQDPNIILVGEIRDLETAEIAFQASQTGHLVLSTLHTNNAVSSITRLIDIGVEPYLVASSVIAIIAQRLVRKLCRNCREPYQPDKGILSRLSLPPGDYTFYRKTGCEECGFSGYQGRIAIFEILATNEKIKNLIAINDPESTVFEAARTNGLQLLAEADLDKVITGITSLE